MAKITVPNYGEFDVQNRVKLVHALEDNAVDILHRCGGHARCTTCLVEVINGDFGPLTEGEIAKGVKEGSRLSCQVYVKGDATVSPIKTVKETNLDPGPRPE